MSLLRALQRILKGEPVFQPQDNSQSVTQSSSTQLSTEQPGSLKELVKPKVYPRLEVGESDCDVDESHMRCYIELQNESDIRLDIDVVRMLGSSLDMGTFLQPGESRRFMIYNGSVLKTPANNRGTIAYRTHPGRDHFTADILIEFSKLPDDGYAVSRIRSIATRDT